MKSAHFMRILSKSKTAIIWMIDKETKKITPPNVLSVHDGVYFL